MCANLQNPGPNNPLAEYHGIQLGPLNREVVGERPEQDQIIRDNLPILRRRIMQAINQYREGEGEALDNNKRIKHR